MQDAMVIFTTPEEVDIIKKLRGNVSGKTVVVTMHLNQTRMLTYYNRTFWEVQHSKDNESTFHNENLYVIWNEKTEFLKKTVDVNPFMSDFFAWIDFGYVRNTLHNGEMMLRNIPRDLKTDQVLMLDVTNLLGGTKMIGGGFIGGYAPGITRWHQEYYAVLDKNKDGFIGKDQAMMQVTCDNCPGLCKLIIPDNSQGNPWFYMTAYLSGRTTSQQFKQIIWMFFTILSCILYLITMSTKQCKRLSLVT